MSVFILKNCYGCGRGMRFSGFQLIPDVPMCRFCSASEIKPRYVYINKTKEIIPLYEPITVVKRAESKVWLRRREEGLRILMGNSK